MSAVTCVCCWGMVRAQWGWGGEGGARAACCFHLTRCSSTAESARLYKACNTAGSLPAPMALCFLRDSSHMQAPYNAKQVEHPDQVVLDGGEGCANRT